MLCDVHDGHSRDLTDTSLQVSVTRGHYVAPVLCVCVGGGGGGGTNLGHMWPLCSNGAVCVRGRGGYKSWSHVATM